MKRNGYGLIRRIKALETQIQDTGADDDEWAELAKLPGDVLDALLREEVQECLAAGKLELTAFGFAVPEGIVEDRQELLEIAEFHNQELHRWASARIPYPPRGSIFNVNGFSIMEEGTSGRELVMTAELDRGPDGRFSVPVGADNADLLVQLAEILNSALPERA